MANQLGAILKRLPEWRQRLIAVIDAQRGDPFEWGRRDCALFAADCVEAMTGTDPAAAYRGTYTNEVGARLALKRAGFDDIPSLIASVAAEIPVAMARVGDVCVIEVEGEWSVGVVNGERIFARAPAGLVTVDLMSAAKAYRIE